jgi:hypothetical protein
MSRRLLSAGVARPSSRSAATRSMKTAIHHGSGRERLVIVTRRFKDVGQDHPAGDGVAIGSSGETAPAV